MCLDLPDRLLWADLGEIPGATKAEGSGVPPHFTAKIKPNNQGGHDPPSGRYHCMVAFPPILGTGDRGPNYLNSNTVTINGLGRSEPLDHMTTTSTTLSTILVVNLSMAVRRLWNP